ncbi:MAG: endonuclease/exonuclease/phosphatase family protein [Phycisphaerales bacterium]|nr:MAG: endonuclease/exonuclease/phosphatase family protein [Phycisphaerales bacterium]
MSVKPRNRAADLLAWSFLAAGVLGLLMRYAAKDRVPALAVVFYGLPPLVAALLFAVSLALGLRRPRRRWQVVVPGVLMVVALIAWIQTDLVRSRGAGGMGDPLRVVLWNVSRPSATDASFVPVLQEADAQILFLVECGGHSAARRHFWESHFPGYHVSLLPGQIALLSRYPIAGVHCTTADSRTVVAEYDLILPGGTLAVVAVDVASAHCSRRRYSFEQINAIARSKRRPVLVLGDFNTPHTSILFDELRRSFCHAFEESGTGLITTWPSLFPVLALDHIWLSEGLAPVHTVLRRTLHSDHALVIADIAVEKAGTPHELVSSVER